MTEIYEKVNSGANMAEFIYQSADVMAEGHENKSEIDITNFFYGLSAVAKKISTELNDVANILMSGKGVQDAEE